MKVAHPFWIVSAKYYIGRIPGNFKNSILETNLPFPAQNYPLYNSRNFEASKSSFWDGYFHSEFSGHIRL